MYNVRADELLLAADNTPILDVRSPGEYMAGHIPGAISFPLFTNEERATVGTLFKQQGKRVALKSALELVGPKMTEFVSRAERIGSSKFAIYCWRGGMRSKSMAWLLSLADFEVAVLTNGYKAYRHLVLDFFEQERLPLQVLSGYTGSRKTDLLKRLDTRGEQVIDLEGIAGHQGSSFGNKKCKEQPTTEQFQNLLYTHFKDLDLERPVWIEDESIRIGRVNLPEGLFRQINTSPHVLLEVAKEERINFLLEDYGELEPDQLVEATRAISKKLGSERSAHAIRCIDQGLLREAAEIILSYYDGRYDKAISGKAHLIADNIRFQMKDLDKVAEQLIIKTRSHV